MTYQVNILHLSDLLLARTEGIECCGCIYNALLLSKKLSLTVLHSSQSLARQSCFTQKVVHLTAEASSILTTVSSHNG